MLKIENLHATVADAFTGTLATPQSFAAPPGTLPGNVDAPTGAVEP
jgi:hypothetical protein